MSRSPLNRARTLHLSMLRYPAGGTCAHSRGSLRANYHLVFRDTIRKSSRIRQRLRVSVGPVRPLVVQIAEATRRNTLQRDGTSSQPAASESA